MSPTRISEEVRRRIAQAARFRCGYCLMPQHMVAITFHLEHIIPLSQGGQDSEDNLWLAWPLCNLRKGSRLAAIDPESGDETPLYNPRTQAWREHFAFSQQNTTIVGLSAAGRATVEALALNAPALVEARRWWVELGQYPPSE